MPQTQWSPRTIGIIASGAVGAALATFAVTLSTEVPGRVLGSVAGLGLLVFAVGSWRARPKLAITRDGLLVHGWWRAQLLRRADLKRVRIIEFRRIGRRVALLEIETHDERLVLLSRWDLGVDPVNVLDALTAAGYTGR